MKKLYRCRKGKIFNGTLSGLGRYFDTDTSLLRLAFIFLTVLTGLFPFVAAYILAAFIVPLEPENSEGEK